MLGLAVSAQAKTVHVQVGPNNTLIFSPATVTINVGDTVQWDWVGNNHTVTSGGCCSFNGLFDLGTKSTSPPTGQNAGFAASHTFTQPGSFPYFCRVHGSNFGMTGSVTVLTPDYSISMAASTVTAFPNQTATFTGLLTTQSGYNSQRSEEHTSELQSRFDLVCRLLLEKKNEQVSHCINEVLNPQGVGVVMEAYH